MNILDRIVAQKKIELVRSKRELPQSELSSLPLYDTETFSLSARLINSQRQMGIIAEIKKASPSKGVLLADLNEVELFHSYQKADVEGISVLTEREFFQGDLLSLAKMRRLAGKIPLLRKDFIFDPYQIMEAKGFGASVVLLIASILEEQQYRELYQQAKALKMEVLTEIHNFVDLNKVCKTFIPELIGINNRDLTNFTTTLEDKAELYQAVPEEAVLISESGIYTNSQITYLRSLGVKGVLVGEHLVKAADRQLAIKELVG